MHILWIKTELLHPVDKGGRIRTYQMLRALRREHRISYVTLDDGTAAPDALEKAAEYAHDVIRVPFTPAPKGSPRFFADLAANLFSPLPYAVARYRSPAMRQTIERVLREARQPVEALVCDFLAPSLNVPSGLPVPTILFQHNVEAMIWERHASVPQHALRRRYMRLQYERMRRHEAAECRRFDHVIAVSEQDAEVFARDFGVARVSHVPTGVDTQYFRPSGTIPREPLELVFTGSMDWMPNEDAIRWFVAEMLPLIRARLPQATVTVVGRNPPATIRALASEPGVRVTGSVPDVRPYLERAAAFIVPIRVGGGTRLKIFEAMAMERPVISTTVGAEGLPVRDGQDVSIADEPHTFADAVIRLLENPDRAAAMGARAAASVRANFGWERVAQRFAALCADTAHPRAVAGTSGSAAGVASPDPRDRDPLLSIQES